MKNVNIVLVSGLLLIAAVAAHASTVEMSESTALTSPIVTNVVINKNADWRVNTITAQQAKFLINPHEYQGHKVCVLDMPAGAGFTLDCELRLQHARSLKNDHRERYEVFDAFHDFDMEVKK